MTIMYYVLYEMGADYYYEMIKLASQCEPGTYFVKLHKSIWHMAGSRVNLAVFRQWSMRRWNYEVGIISVNRKWDLEGWLKLAVLNDVIMKYEMMKLWSGIINVNIKGDLKGW